MSSWWAADTTGSQQLRTSAAQGIRSLSSNKHRRSAARQFSAQAFSGVDARLSRYSYLVSLMPQSIREDLDLDISLIRRRYSSYTPVPGTDRGLLIDAEDAERTRASFEAIGAGDDYMRWLDFYRDTQVIAASLFPTMTEPMMTKEEFRRLLDLASPGRNLYGRFIETPIVTLVNETFESDIVRGVVLTDALIGTFPDGDDDSAMRACFLYHVIGGGTGDWDVPTGGMGSVSSALEKSARQAGATIVTGRPGHQDLVMIPSFISCATDKSSPPRGVW
jgi:phytoene dehydrogenase-like protein